MTMCQSAVVNRTVWFRSALAAASGLNRLDLVKLRYPSLCNFAKKIPEKEGNSDPKLVSCKYWDTTVEMLMVGISVILSATNQKIDAWKTEVIIFSFPASTYHLMYQLEESIHFAINRHLSSPVSKTVLNDDVISFTAGMQTLWTESNLPSIYKHADHCCGEFKIDDTYQPSNWKWRIFLSSPARHRAKLCCRTTSTAADPSIDSSPPWRTTSPTRSTP